VKIEEFTMCRELTSCPHVTKLLGHILQTAQVLTVIVIPDSGIVFMHLGTKCSDLNLVRMRDVYRARRGNHFE